MTWGEVKVGDVLEWTSYRSEIYLVLARESAVVNWTSATERLRLLCLHTGEVVWWPLRCAAHEPLSVISVAKVA